MKEIKIRAWDKFNKVMVYSDKNYPLSEYKIEFDWTNGNKLSLMKLIDARYGEFRTFDADIMQSTGLEDKNGKEIYTGDIIKVLRKHWNNCGKEYLEKITEEIGEVVFYKNWEISLKTKEKEGTLYQPFLWIFEDEEDHEIEIIGNVYQNKDLLI